MLKWSVVLNGTRRRTYKAYLYFNLLVLSIGILTYFLYKHLFRVKIKFLKKCKVLVYLCVPAKLGNDSVESNV